MLSDQTVKDSLDLVVSVYKGFREELMLHYGNRSFTEKADTSWVTEEDEKIERALQARLAEAFPTLGFRGEETGQHNSAEQFWLVDPIDGTSLYVRGIWGCTNMAALVDGDTTVAAVIYDFVNDECYTAIRGQGAYKNDEPIRVSDRSSKQSMILVESKHFEQYGPALNEAGMFNVEPMYSAGHGFLLVASGKIEARIQIEAFGKDYDYAPGALLVAEAGGTLVTFDSKPYRYDTLDFAASNAEVAEDIARIIKDARQ